MGEKIKCVLQINIGNNIEIKVKGSYVVGLISVKSEFLDAIVTLFTVQWRIIIYQFFGHICSTSM